MQKPVNNSGLRCHHDRKPVEKVCHLCPKYILVRGSNPQTGKEVDTWDCADAWNPLLLIEVANEIRKTDAEVSALRKDVRENNPVIKMLDNMNGSTKSLT